MSYAKYVRLPKFEELTGYTQKAVRSKIENGVWTQGKEWLKAPDGHILVNMEGFHRWANPQEYQGAAK